MIMTVMVNISAEGAGFHFVMIMTLCSQCGESTPPHVHVLIVPVSCTTHLSIPQSHVHSGGGGWDQHSPWF